MQVLHKILYHCSLFEQLVGTQITAGFNGNMYKYSTAYLEAHSCEKTFINLVEEYATCDCRHSPSKAITIINFWFLDWLRCSLR